MAPAVPHVLLCSQKENVDPRRKVSKQPYLSLRHTGSIPHPDLHGTIINGTGFNVQTTGAEPSDFSMSNKIKIGISGGGPRAMNHIISLVALLCIHENKLNELRHDGIDFSIEVTAFEKQPEKRGAGGNAFQSECDATLNTSVPGQMKIPGIEKLAKTHPIVDAATDLAKTVAHIVECDPQKFVERYKTRNLAAYSLFKNALRPDGTFDTSIPCLTRDMLGAGLTKNVNDVIAYANEALPFVDINICYSQHVIGADFSDPEAPVLIVNGEDGEVKRHAFDMVFLANGTPLKSRVPKSILQRTYQQIPNHDSLSMFLHSLRLFDNHNNLKRGTKLAIIGAGLSAYDYLTILATRLGIVVPCNSKVGYQIDPAAAAKYQDCMTLVNPTPGKIAPPAISKAPPGLASAGSLCWPAGLPNGIGVCDEIHSTLLQKHFESFSLFQMLTKANIARALGTVPRKVNEPKSTKERLADYQRQIEIFLSDEGLPEWGFWKNSYLLLMAGTGFHSNAGEADKRLSKKAPLTHSPYNILRKYRAYISAYTDPSYVEKASNTEAAKIQDEVHRMVAPSPIACQQIVNWLSEAGVLNQVCGKSDELRMSDDGQFVELGGSKFHAILAPKAMNRGADTILGSLTHSVRQVAPGQPEFAKGCFLVGNDGRPLNVYACGMIGEGTRVKNADGTTSLVGRRWIDSNSYANVMELVCQAPYLTLSFAILKSVGIKDPVAHIHEHYRANLPESHTFNAEAARFKDEFDELMQKTAFLRLCEVLAGDDGVLYREYTDKVFSHQDRAAFVEGLRLKKLSEAETVAFEKYQHKTTNPTKYQPVSVEEFTDRFVDFTDKELDKILRNAMKVADAHAGSGTAKAKVSL